MFTRKESVLKWGAALGVFAVGAMFWACSGKDGVAGGASGDMGIVAKDIAGEAQKGPFVKGSAVTVQGIDCKTLELTDEIFEGKVKSDKGDFAFDDVTLSSTCALFEATGKYRNELTGKKSSEELTLHALTDLKDRKDVNINVLTELEYERVMFLVTEKGKKFADAKARAEKEVLAAFGIAGNFDNSEDLTIYESGDGNAALLAVSVLMQAETDDAGLAKRIEKFADSFAETGKWNDDKTKATIEEWQVVATADGTLDSIRKNVEGWGYADVVPAFEKYVEAFGDDVIPASSGDLQSSSSVSSSSSANASSVYDSTANTLKDLRDGKVYKTVTIGDQVWMAENLNIETDSSLCYNDSTKYCSKYGRLYSWAVANSVCPEGWHLPTIDEFETLFATVGGQSTAGKKLKSASGWENVDNGTDDFGFNALPAGFKDSKSGRFYGEGEYAEFWGADYNGNYAYLINLRRDAAGTTIYDKDFTEDGKPLAASVRCLKGDTAVPKSSSSAKSSSSGNSSSSQYKRVLCNVDTDKNCFKDERDGQTYKTVTIGTQTWMAENLNLETESSSCYNDYAEKCEKNGRLYTWGAAMDSAGVWSTDGKGCGSHEEYGTVCSATFPVRGVCPEGWHLPDTTEWNVLFDAIGEQLFAGRFWSSVEHNTGYNTEAYGMRSYSEYFPEGLFSNKKRIELSVRCLKNDDGTAPKSSSSSAAPCKAETEDNCEYGTLTDSRDGQTYKTVKIGGQVWMAENLNYADSVKTPSLKGKSWCNANDSDNCVKYGRLYTWAAAIDSVKLYTETSMDCGYYGQACALPDLVQGICPTGWHLPSKSDWDALITAVGDWRPTAGKVLKSQSDWNGDGRGEDSFGFSALPAGSRGAMGYFDSVGAAFWSSSAESDAGAYGLSLHDDDDEVVLVNYVKKAAYSVRCIKD